MYSYMIDEVTDKVCRALDLPVDFGAEGRKKVAGAISEYFEDKAIHTWGVEDVKFTAKEIDLAPTDKQCREILANVENKIDSEYGITWDTIRSAIEDYRDNEFSDEKIATLEPGENENENEDQL